MRRGDPQLQNILGKQLVVADPLPRSPQEPKEETASMLKPHINDVADQVDR